MDEGRLRRIAAALADRAEGGDLAACKLLLAYLIGRPGQAADPDRVDEHELSVVKGRPGENDWLLAMLAK